MASETITFCPWPRPAGWCSTCKTWDPALIADVVERTRREQGPPAKVTDPLTLRNVATLLGTSGSPIRRRSGKPPAQPDSGFTVNRGLTLAGGRVGDRD